MANRISFLIWAVALLVHTCLLALIISFDDLELVGPVVVFGFILTFFITLPALFLVRIIIAVCDKLDLNGQQALLTMLISCVALAALTYMVAAEIFEKWPLLFFTGITSSAIATLSQHKAIAEYFVPKNHSHEN